MGLQESGLYQAKKWVDLCGIIKLCQVKKACGITSKLKEGYASVSMGIALWIWQEEAMSRFRFKTPVQYVYPPLKQSLASVGWQNQGLPSRKFMWRLGNGPNIEMIYDLPIFTYIHLKKPDFHRHSKFRITRGYSLGSNVKHPHSPSHGSKSPGRTKLQLVSWHASCGQVAMESS